MKKHRTWPKVKYFGHKLSGFFVVPKKKPNPAIPSDASFGDFNAPLFEQDRGRPKSRPPADNGSAQTAK